MSYLLISSGVEYHTMYAFPYTPPISYFSALHRGTFVPSMLYGAPVALISR